MHPHEFPRGRRFLMRELDLKRIQALRGTDYYEKRVARARQDLQPLIDTPWQVWDAKNYDFSHKQGARYDGLMDMVLMYHLSGDDSYAKAAARDVLVMAETSEKSGRRLSVSSIEETLMCVPMMFVNEWLADFLSEEDRERIRQAVYRTMPHHAHEMARSTVNQKQVQNHLFLESVGMMMQCLYYNDIQDTQRWGQLAAKLAVRYMRDAFHADGVQNEAAGGYHGLCVYVGIITALFLRDYGDRDLMREEWFRSVMKRSLDWLAALNTPSGHTVAFNDSFTETSAWMFRFGAYHFGSSHFQIMADRVEQQKQWRPQMLFDLLFYEPTVPAEIDPQARSVFPNGGTVTLRNGWNAESGMLIQKVGSYIGGHAHRDRLNFEYWHQGEYLMRDLGGKANVDWDIFNGYNKQTSSHNVVGIHDPKEAKGSRTKKQDDSEDRLIIEHRGHDLAQGRILKVEDQPAYGWITSQAEIYSGVMQRRILLWFKKSGALLVFDRIASKEPQVFDQLFHGEGALRIEGSRFLFEGNKDQTQRLAGSALEPQGAELVGIGRPKRALGAPKYVGVRRQARRPLFLTLLEPYTSSPPPARVLNKGSGEFEWADLKIAIGLKDEKLEVHLNGQLLLNDDPTL